MPTIIDSLLIELGLDASKFQKGQAAAVEQFDKTKKETTRAAREIEQQFNSVNESIEGLHRSLLALFAVFTGGRTLKALIGDLTDTGAAAGRLAGNIGMSVKELDTFGRAVERMGGSAGDAQASFQKFADQYATFQTTGQLGDLPRIIGQLNTFGHVSVDVTKPLGNQIDAIADGLERIAKTDPVKAQFLARQIFGNAGMANLALQGSRKMREALAEASAGALTPKQTEVMKKLQDAVNTLKQAFESVGNAIVEAIGPKTTELFKSLAKWVQDNIGFVKDLALAFGVAAAAMIGLKIAFVAASLAMTMTPLGKILVLMSLLAGAVVYLRENWEKAGPYVTGVMDDWKSRFWGMIDAIKNGGPLLLEAFKQGFSDAFDWLAQKLEWLWTRVPGHELLSGLWERTKTGLSWMNKEFGVGSAQGREYEGNPAAEGYDSAGRRRAPGHGRRRVMERGTPSAGDHGRGERHVAPSHGRRRVIERAAPEHERSGPRGEKGYRENIPVPPTRERERIGKETEKAFPPSGGKSPAFVPTGEYGKKAAQIRDRLMKDFNLTKEQASGVVGSLAAETKGFTQYQEFDKGRGTWRPGARGGWGWAQWTGQRRRAFERYIKETGLDPYSDEANYGFLAKELRTTQANELRRLRKARTTEEAARIFTGSKREGRGFLRPGAEHYGPSIRWAQKAYNAPSVQTANRISRSGSGHNRLMHRGDRGALNSSSLPTFARMGAMAQSANTTNNSHAVTNNSSSNSANIQAVNINVPHADPNTIATGLDAAIRRQMYSGMANYGAR